MNQTILLSFFAMSVRMAAPYLFASMGEMYSQKSGVMNIGLEGLITIGAFMSFIGAYFTQDRYIGLLMAMVSCLIVGFIYAVFVVIMHMNQSITGISFNLLILGSASFVYRLIFGTPTVLPIATNVFKTLSIPLLSKIPFVGPVLFQQYGMVYVALAFVLFSIFFFDRTKPGIAIISCGEMPSAAETRGINVVRTRMLCVMLSAVMASIAGAYLSIAVFNQFAIGMAAGRGYIAYTLVIFGKWDPKRILLGSLLFGALEAAALVVQASVQEIPYQFLLMAPYLLTIVALIATSMKSRNARPAYLGVPYKLSR